MECRCGFTCGTEGAFQQHLLRFIGTPFQMDHYLARRGVLPAGGDYGLKGPSPVTSMSAGAGPGLVSAGPRYMQMQPPPQAAAPAGFCDAAAAAGRPCGVSPGLGAHGWDFMAANMQGMHAPYVGGSGCYPPPSSVAGLGLGGCAPAGHLPMHQPAFPGGMSIPASAPSLRRPDASDPAAQRHGGLGPPGTGYLGRQDIGDEQRIVHEFLQRTQGMPQAAAGFRTPPMPPLRAAVTPTPPRPPPTDAGVGLHVPAAPCQGYGDPGCTDMPADPSLVNSVAMPCGRAMSLLSQEAFDGLAAVTVEITALEARVEEVRQQVVDGLLTPGQARTQLAQVEAQANKVECNKIDSIYTSELTSGKDEAKKSKKEQLQRIEKLLEKLEAEFKWLKSLGA